jgi:signal transduction histidine kinase
MLSANQTGSTWRVTTAARVFVLALAFGRALSADGMRDLLATFVAVTLVATVTCLLEGQVPDRQLVWLPLVEGVLISVLLATSQTETDHLLVYLAVPVTVAGLRHGWVALVNTTLACVITLLLVWLNVGSAGERTIAGGLFWLGVGVGTGLLAAWQTRTLRELIDAGAPVAEAHRLLVQLQALALDGQIGLDSSGAGELLGSSIQKRVDSTRAAVFAYDRDGSLALLWSRGQIEGLAEAAAQVEREVVSTPQTLAIPVISADRVIAVVVLGDVMSWQNDPAKLASRIAGRHALRLDTALIFDDVRGLATSEERHRIAREMHDGVAQELVALGYAIDEIASVTQEDAVRDLATTLRAEISRVVSDLRFSIFDLRHEVADRPLTTALADYANAVAAQADLVLHLTLDEGSAPPSFRVRTEVLRIAQEAIGNVRRHSHAANLWITCTTDARSLHLRVEDDGVGNAAPRDHHYGLQTMRERAEHIGATLKVLERPDGGTIVELSSRSLELQQKEAADAHHRHAGR